MSTRKGRMVASWVAGSAGCGPVVVLSDIAVPLISADQPMAAGSIAWILRTAVSTRCTPADAMKLSVLQVKGQLDWGWVGVEMSRATTCPLAPRYRPEPP